MKISTIYRVVFLLIIGQMFLLIMFNNLPFPFSTFYFYLFLFLSFLLVTKPQIFIEGSNKRILLFAIYYITFFILGIYNNNDKVYNINWLFISELLPILISTTLFTYFIKYSDLNNLIIVVRFSLIFIAITGITSIIGLYLYPMAARDLAGVLVRDKEFGLIEFYQKIGIAGYDYYYGLAFIMPVFIVLLKKHWTIGHKKYILFLFIFIVFYSIVKSQMTTAFLYTIIGIIFSIFGARNPKKTLVYLFIILIALIFIPDQVYVNSIRNLSSQLHGETLKNNLDDLSIALEYKFEGVEDDKTHISQRAERIPFLMGYFLKSPIIGGGESTGHVFWLDRLSLFGISGLIPWLFLLFYIVKTTIKRISKEYVYYYLITIILFISVGFMKNSGGRIVYFCVFFLAPSILIIYSNNKSIIKH